MFWDSFYSVHILSLHRSLMSNHVAAYNHVITLFVYWKKAACFTAAGFRQRNRCFLQNFQHWYIIIKWYFGHVNVWTFTELLIWVNQWVINDFLQNFSSVLAKCAIRFKPDRRWTTTPRSRIFSMSLWWDILLFQGYEATYVEVSA